MKLFANEAVQCGATISGCGAYRYRLWRVWNDCLPLMVFVMLNPSTADADVDDPTVRRCMGFARRDGFGGIEVLNVFALRSTDPKHLLAHSDPGGPENEAYLLGASKASTFGRLVVAWGREIGTKRLAKHYGSARAICRAQSAFCLGLTKDGHPRHPLYVPGDEPLVEFAVK
jgi:hypothetical protein